MPATPSGSRAASIAGTPARESPAASFKVTTPHKTRLAPSSSSSSSHQRYLDSQPGCSHLAALSSSDLKQYLKRYSLGIRWGKRVRRGLVKSEEDQEEDEYEAQRAAYHGYTHEPSSSEQNGKRSKVSGASRLNELLIYLTLFHCTALAVPYLHELPHRPSQAIPLSGMCLHCLSHYISQHKETHHKELHLPASPNCPAYFCFQHPHRSPLLLSMQQRRT